MFVYNVLVTNAATVLTFAKSSPNLYMCQAHRERAEKMSRENWKAAKKQLNALGIAVNTRVKSCELGCACVGDPWSDENRGNPQVWQTGKRFSPQGGGQLNHANLTDAHKWQIMATLNANGISWEWGGESHRTIGIDFEANA
jgi:hypothetical protein